MTAGHRRPAGPKPLALARSLHEGFRKSRDFSGFSQRLPPGPQISSHPQAVFGGIGFFWKGRGRLGKK